MPSWFCPLQNAVLHEITGHLGTDRSIAMLDSFVLSGLEGDARPCVTPLQASQFYHTLKAVSAVFESMVGLVAKYAC